MCDNRSLQQKTGWEWLDNLISYAIEHGSVAAIMVECPRCGKPIERRELRKRCQDH